jgi:hypothetical protein
MRKKELELPLQSYDISENEYKEIWQASGPIQAKMIEKHEPCLHDLEDAFIYENPYKKPDGLCNALQHVLDLYTWRVALGFPSWEQADRTVFKIHCPAKDGTVWELRKIDKE